MILIASILKFVGAVLGFTGIAMCAVLVWREIRRAPDGAEGREGYHNTRRPAHPHFTRHKLHH